VSENSTEELPDEVIVSDSEQSGPVRSTAAATPLETPSEQDAPERAEARVAHLERVIDSLREDGDAIRRTLRRAEARVAHLERVIDSLREEGDSLREMLRRAEADAQEYHALMSTKTMRLLRPPRTVYARIRQQSDRRRASTG
jgi:chromosome segregation ATPase